MKYIYLERCTATIMPPDFQTTAEVRKSLQRVNLLESVCHQQIMKVFSVGFNEMCKRRNSWP